MTVHEEHDSSRPRHHWWRRVLILTCTLLAVVVLTITGVVYVLSDQLIRNVDRIPSVFASLDPGQRPPRSADPTEQGTTFLLAGSDSLAAEPTTGTDAAEHAEFQPGAQRSDVIMLMRFNAALTRAVVVSIPRDSWVPVPGHGQAKINAAFSYGGPALLVQTVEALTRTRIDHYASVDFAGFEAMIDAVDGIDVTIARPTSFGTLHFHAGVNHLDGGQALAYVRQRKHLPRGDLDRVQRQQNAMRALLAKVGATTPLADPISLYQLVDAMSRSIDVDDTLTDSDLRSLAFGLRNLQGGQVTFLTAPVSGLGREGNQSVVYLDAGRTPALWQAFNGDDMAAYVTANASDVLGASPP
ncbi:MAG: LCP family protein [Kibdelosporangium sp.]